jgi:DNA invertase Pin-like site-specific DNA recombinase
LALQFDALRAAACSVIHDDATSGRCDRDWDSSVRSRISRARYLVPWKLDRLGRSLRHCSTRPKPLRERGMALRSLTEHIDTSTAAGQMFYSLLGAVAQFERGVLRERAVAGLAAAMRRGERLGRPFALTPARVREAKQMIARGESPNHVARLFRVGRSTLYRAIAL